MESKIGKGLIVKYNVQKDSVSLFRFLQDNWCELKKCLKEEYEISDVSYNTWLKSLEISSLMDEIIVLNCGGEHNSSLYIKKKYGIPIEHIIEEIVGIKLVVLVEGV